MKNTFLFFLIFFIKITLTYSQDESLFSQTITTVIYAKDIDKSKALLKKLVDSTRSETISYHEGSDYNYEGKKISATIWCNKTSYGIIDNSLSRLGRIDDKELSTINNIEQLKSIEAEIKFNKEQKNSFQQELDRLDKNSQNYTNYWNEIRAKEKVIFELEKQSMNIKSKSNQYVFSITVLEDIGTPQQNNKWKVQYVNMPGLEYNYLRMDNPQSGISASVYQGAGVKYLFTRGKSFITFNVLKNASTVSDSSTFKELFTYGFGQDFYPHHFGGGRRKFLNLYTGYNIGGVFATSSSSSKSFPYITPSVGLELYKNKYILLDTKVGYFVPIDKNTNFHLRGIASSISFNFVF
jgi:hypothetical protein